MKFNLKSLGLIESTEEPDIAFSPNCIVYGGMARFVVTLPAETKQYIKELLKQQWQFHLVNQNRGRCYYAGKVITVPAWVTKNTQSKQTWYISHEMAHAHAGWQAKHGPVFMEQLIRICPVQDIVHELGYKPRNAKAAGIDLLDLLKD